MTGARALLAVAFATSLGCSSTGAPTGADEPIRVRGASFKPGDLPGIPPVDAGAGGGAPGQPLVSPHVTVLNTVNRILWPGQSGKSISGRTTQLATAVGVRFVDLGTGYWLVPTDLPDPTAGDELQWSMTFDVGPDVPPGLHTLRFGAVDEYERAGSLTDLDVCVTPSVPDNYNACDPTIPPPFAVLSLEWDSEADLDLAIKAPDGKWVDAKHPTTAGISDGGVAPDPAEDGIFDRDANANCAADRQRSEHLVWQGKPAAGVYLVYVNPFAACGAAAARFHVTLDQSEPSEDGGTSRLVRKVDVPGELLGASANGGSGEGLYVTAFSIH